jgi:hypothetical protein
MELRLRLLQYRFPDIFNACPDPFLAVSQYMLCYHALLSPTFSLRI